MKFALVVAAIVLLGGPLSGEVVQAQKVAADYDKTAPFPTYKTFSFPTKGGARNPFVNEMIIAAATRELTARGLTRVPDNGDLIVSHMAASGFNLQVAQVSFGYTVNPVYSDSGVLPSAGAAMWDVVTGTLLIDLYDRKTDRIVFRGTAKDVLQRMPSGDLQADAKMVTKPVNKSVAKIFKKYPKANKP